MQQKNRKFWAFTGQAKRIESVKIFRWIKLKEYIASKITQTETIEPINFLGFKPKPKIYFSRPDQIWWKNAASKWNEENLKKRIDWILIKKNVRIESDVKKQSPDKKRIQHSI
jgi:hypothetical protein